MGFNLATYEYETGGYYPAFKRGTDEKLCAQLASGAVADKLRDNGLVYNTHHVIPVADIGCGPADSIQMYLKGAKHAPGFEVHATDHLTKYTGPDGEARSNLEKAQKEGVLPLPHISVTQGDAFAGNLNGLMGTEPNHFPLAFISHMVYHSDPEKIPTLLSDVAHNVLTKEGVAIAFHVEKTDGTFQHFRSKYGRKQDTTQGNGDTPPPQVDNPPQAIQDACDRQGIPCYTARLTNNYYFEAMDDRYWEMFKHPEQYDTIKDPKAKENLLRLYFIVQRAANEFAADKSETGLSAFIDEIKPIITGNDPIRFSIKGGFLPLAESVQLIGHADATEETKEKIQQTTDALQGVLPELERKAYAQWERRWARTGLAA